MSVTGLFFFYRIYVIKNLYTTEEVEEVSVTAPSILLNMATISIFGVKEFNHFLDRRSAPYIVFEFKCFGFQISPNYCKASFVILAAI